MRKGFSMLTAIIFLILVATIATLTLTLSSQSLKQTNDVFLRSQAELLAKSATEYALLAISGHDINATNNCVNSINTQYPQAGNNAIFDINITLHYIGNGLPNGCNALSNSLSTNDSNLTVIIDTIIATTTENNISSEPIRLHRRTIQKP